MIENNRPSLTSVDAEITAAIKIQEWPKSLVTPQWWASNPRLLEHKGSSII